jgi:hypothetical protein
LQAWQHRVLHTLHARSQRGYTLVTHTCLKPGPTFCTCLCCAFLQLQLHRSAPRGSLSLAQQQLLAEATVAVAFSTRQPLLLLQAAGAFKQLEQAATKVWVWGGGAEYAVIC